MQNKQIIINEIHCFYKNNNYDVNSSSIIIPVINQINEPYNKDVLTCTNIFLNEEEYKIKDLLECFLTQQMSFAINNDNDDLVIIYLNVLDVLASCFYQETEKSQTYVSQVLTLI